MKYADSSQGKPVQTTHQEICETYKNKPEPITHLKDYSNQKTCEISAKT